MDGAHAKDLARYGVSAVSITPGWMRFEITLDNYGVTQENRRDATFKSPALCDFRIAAFCRTRCSRTGRRPGAKPAGRTIPFQRRLGEGLWLHCWRYIREVQEAGKLPCAWLPI